LRGGVFDTVLLSDVLEHVPEPVSLLLEVARILSPGGRLILNVPFMYWLHEVPNDYFRYTEYGLTALAKRAGFEVLLLEPYGGALDVVADILGKVLLRIPLVGVPTSLLLQGTARTIARTSWGNRFRQSSSRTWPLGYFMVAERPKLLSLIPWGY
jgi:SAM-dependent methyltransferase